MDPQITYLKPHLKIINLFLRLQTGVWTRAAVVHSNFRVGSTFPVPVCTVSPGHLVNKADTQ